VVAASVVDASVVAASVVDASVVDASSRIPHAGKRVQPRNFSHVVGVDLGGGKGKKTALATLRVDALAATVVEIAPRGGARPFYDTTLIETIRQFGDGTLLCLDAPLTLPPCLRCEVPVCPGQDRCVDPAVVAMRAIFAEASAADPELAGGRGARRGKPSLTPYTQRTTEVFLSHRLGLVPREALGQSTGPLAARAAHVTRALADRFRLNENLLEVYPKGTLAALGFSRPYKKHLHEREMRARILDALSGDLRFGPGVWRERCVQSDHLFEAVICAYTGYLWARDGWVAPAPFDGLVGDGWIWTPPPTADAAALPVSATGKG
jgi:hypothetical protein